jgi:hypothetical protein
MILFADNLQAYNTVSQMVEGPWAAIETYSDPYITLENDPDPLIGATGQVLQTDNGTIAVSGMRFVLPNGAVATAGIGYRMWTSELPSGNWGSWQGPLLGFRTSANDVIAYVGLMSDGSLSAATNRDGTGALGSSGGPVIVAGAWNHIEAKLYRDATAGTIQVKVNGVTKLNLTGLALGSNNVGQIFLGVNNWNFNNSNKGDTYYKDIVFWDGSGSNNNDFLGDVSVVTLKPTADSALTWTPSTGTTGWNLIDELPSNDTDYISTATTGANVFDLENLPPEYVAVKALISVIRMNKNDGGTANVQVGLVSGGDEDTGADRPVTSAATYWYDVSEQNPDTASAWTPTSVNAAQLRINRTL